MIRIVMNVIAIVMAMITVIERVIADECSSLEQSC